MHKTLKSAKNYRLTYLIEQTSGMNSIALQKNREWVRGVELKKIHKS